MTERTYWATVKQYFRFNPEEQKALLIQIVVFAFILSFKDWGEESFSLITGLSNYLLAVIVVAISLLVHEAGHRFYGIKYGFRVESKLWWYGIFIGLILVIISNGNIMFFAAHGIFIHVMAVHRLGHFRYGPNIFAFAMVALAGPLMNIFLATIVKTLEVWFGIPISTIAFLHKLFMFNWIYAVCNLLPIPPLDGTRIIFWSRLLYVFVFGCIAGYLLLIFLGIYSYVWALFIGIFAWLYFLVYHES